jgi:hypothetical protein
MNRYSKYFFACALMLLSIFLLQCGLITDDDSKGQQIEPNEFFTIYYPNSSYGVKLDSNYTITWETTDSVDADYIIIELYEDDELVMEIIDRTANDGEYEWYVPSALGSGSNYTLKIINYDNSDQYDFSQVFQLYSQYQGVITVTRPNSNTEVDFNSSLTIQWTSTGNIGTRVSITLMQDGDSVMVIDASEVDDGSYPWSNVTSPNGSGSNYQIQVASTSDPGIKDLSGDFTISSPYSGSFDVTSPTSSSDWSTGTSYDITWTSTGSPGSTVRLELYQADTNLIQTIGTASRSSGSRPWPVPASIVSGDDYSIKIKQYQRSRH